MTGDVLVQAPRGTSSGMLAQDGQDPVDVLGRRQLPSIEVRLQGEEREIDLGSQGTLFAVQGRASLQPPEELLPSIRGLSKDHADRPFQSRRRGKSPLREGSDQGIKWPLRQDRRRAAQGLDEGPALFL